MSAPLDASPVFVRAGSVVPYGPDVQYAAELRVTTCGKLWQVRPPEIDGGRGIC